MYLLGYLFVDTVPYQWLMHGGDEGSGGGEGGCGGGERVRVTAL